MTAKKRASRPQGTRASVRMRCSVAGCQVTVHARGLCEPHYEDCARGRGVFAPELAEGRPTVGGASPLKVGQRRDPDPGVTVAVVDDQGQVHTE